MSTGEARARVRAILGERVARALRVREEGGRLILRDRWGILEVELPEDPGEMNALLRAVGAMPEIRAQAEG